MNCDCYILRGDIYLLDYSKSHEGYGDCYGFNYGGGNSQTYTGVKAGNGLLQVNLTQNEARTVQRDGLKMTGCYYPDLTGSNIELSLLCTSIKNLAMAFQGLTTTTASVATPVVDEIYSSPCENGFEQDSFVRFLLPVDPATVVLTRSDLLPFVLNVDYLVNDIGFTILTGLPADVNILATYTSVVRTISSIESFISKPKTFRITVIGKNVSAENEETFIWTFKKVTLTALTNQFQILNEEFPELNFNGEILRDQLADVNESPFMTVEKLS